MIPEYISRWWDEERPVNRAESLDATGWGFASIDAFLRGDFSPYAKMAAREGLEYGIGKTGMDWLVSPQGNFTPLGSGLVGGGSTLISGLLTGNTEGLGGRTATSFGGSTAGSYLGQQAMKQGASPAAAGALGPLAGGIAGGLYEGMTQGRISKGTEWSTIGGMIGTLGGPIGIGLGSLIGGLAGGFLDKKKPRIREVAKTETGNMIVWDGTKFVPQKPMDSKVYVNGEEYNLNPRQKIGLAQKLWKQAVEQANALNEKFAGKNYQELSADDAYAFDKAVEMYSATPNPQSEEEWRSEYEQWMKGMYGDNVDAETALNAMPYEVWRDRAKEKQGWTDNYMNKGFISTGDFDSIQTQNFFRNRGTMTEKGPVGASLNELLLSPEADAEQLYKDRKIQEAWLRQNADLADSENPQLRGIYEQVLAENTEMNRRSNRNETPEPREQNPFAFSYGLEMPQQTGQPGRQSASGLLEEPEQPNQLTLEQIEAVHAPMTDYPDNIEEILRIAR